jgi:hypothetical protein
MVDWRKNYGFWVDEPSYADFYATVSVGLPNRSIATLVSIAQMRDESISGLCRSTWYPEVGIDPKGLGGVRGYCIEGALPSRKWHDRSKSIGRSPRKRSVSATIDVEAQWRIYIRARYCGLSPSKYLSGLLRQAHLGSPGCEYYGRIRAVSRWNNDKHEPLLFEVRRAKQRYDLLRARSKREYLWCCDLSDEVENGLCQGSVVDARNLKILERPKRIETVDDDELDLLHRKLKRSGVLNDGPDGVRLGSARRKKPALWGETVASLRREQRAYDRSDDDYDPDEDEDEDDRPIFNRAVRDPDTGLFVSIEDIL